MSSAGLLEALASRVKKPWARLRVESFACEKFSPRGYDLRQQEPHGGLYEYANGLS